MKTTQLILNLVLTAFPLGFAYSQPTKMDDMNKTAAPSKEVSVKQHSAVGVVKSVDPAKNSATLIHEPVKSLNWPAMTMAFAVKDKALLDKLQPGKKVEFEFVQQGKDYVVTHVK